MPRPELWKKFIEAVERKGRPATVREIGEELYGSDSESQFASAVNVAQECKAEGLVLVSQDYQDVRTTQKGLAFISKL